jgi:hypothetical protein
MTLANPIVITLNGTDYNLPKINLDNYGSEYLYSGTTFELRLKIRHTKEAVKSGQAAQIDRHNVELTQTVYPTADSPAITRQAYAVLRNGYNDDKTAASYLDQGLVDFLTDAHLADVISWQS